MKLILFLAFLLAPLAQAEPVATVALGKQALEHQPFERAASLGFRIGLGDPWAIKPEIGGWLGGRGLPSWFVAAPVGVHIWVPMTGVYGSVAVGPAWISQPDEVLGGHFQFATEMGFGLKTDRGSSGFVWRHFSSAGLAMPNLGRDMIGVQVGVSL